MNNVRDDIRAVFNRWQKASPPEPQVLYMTQAQTDALLVRDDAQRGLIAELRQRLATSRSHWKNRARRAKGNK